MHWPQRLDKRLHRAIEQRARRPTLAAFSNWMGVFTEARNAGNMALPQSFPWTPTFCQNLMARQDPPWSNFDYVANDSSTLPVDPATANQAAVIAGDHSLRRLPSLVLGNTGGSPWYPRQPETTDVNMGEAPAPVAQADAPVAPAETPVAPADAPVAPAENPESTAGSPVMSRAGSPSLIPPRRTEPVDEELIDYSDDDLEDDRKI